MAKALHASPKPPAASPPAEPPATLTGLSPLIREVAAGTIRRVEVTLAWNDITTVPAVIYSVPGAVALRIDVKKIGEESR